MPYLNSQSKAQTDRWTCQSPLDDTDKLSLALCTCPSIKNLRPKEGSSGRISGIQIRSGEVEHIDAGRRLEVEEMRGATHVSCFQDGPIDFERCRRLLDE